MKYIISTSVLLLTLLYAQPPSQNKQLNAISPTGTSKKADGALQNSLDTWFNEDWNPVQEKNKTPINESLHVKKIQKEEDDNNSGFKLQNYVDKWEEYIEEKKKKPKSASHTEMINALPAIGK